MTSHLHVSYQSVLVELHQSLGTSSVTIIFKNNLCFFLQKKRVIPILFGGRGQWVMICIISSWHFFLFCLKFRQFVLVWRCEVHIGLAFILNLQISKRLRHVLATLDGSLGRTGVWV